MVHETGLNIFNETYFFKSLGNFQMTVFVKPDVLALACYYTKCGLRDRLLFINYDGQASARLFSPPPLSGPVLEWLHVYWGADCTHRLCLDFPALIYCNNSTCPERPYITNLSYNSLNCLILSPNYLPPDFTSCYLFTTYSQNTKYQIATEHQDLMGFWGMEKGNWITTQNLFFSFSIKTFFSLSG